MTTPSAILVFDAYGTLFDVHAAAARHREAIGPGWEALSRTWRQKHLEYSWIHGATGQPTSFWRLTELSLDFAAATIGGITADARRHLLAAYRTMAAYPDVKPALVAARGQGARLAILSNGDADMLADAVASAALDGLFDAVISVAEAGTFKPSPRVYELVLDRFGAKPRDVTFYSSNRWDVAGAHAFGFETVWVNRSDQPDEYPDLPAGRVVKGLADALA
jgi:2-haloacid dehalogenase